jgi:hypothetical protein
MMNPRKLVLLNPYQLPTQGPLTLAPEDMACWLNGYAALWHPAALWNASGPPAVAAAYDHEQPQADHLYAVPEAPQLFLPDDWEEKVRAAGSVYFKVTPDRETTLANLRAALAAAGGQEPPPEAVLLDLPCDRVAPFFGVGMGYIVGATLCLAMEHENLLEADEFWYDLQQSIAALGGLPYTRPEPANKPPPDDPYTGTSQYDGGAPTQDSADGAQPDDNYPYKDYEQIPESGDYDDIYGEASAPPEAETPPPDATAPPVEEWYRHIQSAANRLLAAREILYPVPIYLLDIALLDEDRPGAALPPSLSENHALNLIGASSLLEKLEREQPEALAALREHIAAERAEWCGGCYVEREDALLPFESQLWDLLKGQAVARALTGGDVRVFARRRFGAHPQLPLLLSNAGLNRALFVAFDDAMVPQYQTTVVNWPAPDGKQVDCFTRVPLAADRAESFFNLAHHLFKTIREDHYATVALLHRGEPAAPWYRDWLELSRLAPVLGQWVTFSQYFSQVQPGEYASSLSADEFHSDYLSERVGNAQPTESYGGAGAALVPSRPPGPAAKVPVSGFARHARARRRIDTLWTLAAVQRGLAGRNDPLRVEDALRELEEQIELNSLNLQGPAEYATALAELEQKITRTLADRLLARATAEQPGYLILNPCSFTRRVALELEGAATPLPILDPVKACQLDGERLRAVVDVPALGFAWIPREGPKGTLPPALRIRLADERHVRNEFFEAEIDLGTGGLRGIRDPRSGVNRLAERLVFNPGSTMRATKIETTSVGPALGEIVTEGALLGEREQVLAKFRQRFRAWLGRPVLELRVEIYPEQPPAGYPWHAYYGARFAWRDERAMLLRGVNGTGAITTHNRPQTPDYLELRLARQSAVLFPGGLPFHQRQEGRMLDVILMPEGETTHAFELGLALDREQPMQTALGMITPVPLVATSKGPPHIGAKGWLFHLDAPNLVLTGLRPGRSEAPAEGAEPPAGAEDAVTARLLECGAFHTHAELRCVRDPKRVALLDARGTFLMEGGLAGDAALIDVAPGDFTQVQVEFGM